jgi:hypothetical protein
VRRARAHAAKKVVSALFAALAGTLLGASCESSPPPAEEALAADYGVPVVRGALRAPAAEATGVPLSAGAAVSWVLAWDLAGTEAVAGGRRFVTDLGYEVTLTSAHLATVSLEAVPCAEQASLGGRMLRALGPRSAFADHAYDHDESLYSSVLVESILAGEASSYGTSYATGGRYCSVFALSMPVAEACADGTWMLGASVALAGSYAAPSGGEAQSFEASLSLSQGALSDLVLGEEVSLPEQDGAFDAVTITLTRKLQTALDGVELGSVSPVDLADQFLRNVVQSAVVSAAPGP